MTEIRTQHAARGLVVAGSRRDFSATSALIALTSICLPVSALASSNEEETEAQLRVLAPEADAPEAASAPRGDEPAPPETPENSESFLSKLTPEVHGFVSQGFMKSTANNYLAESERGTFEFSEVGLNFTKQLTDHFRVGMQFFMRDLGPLGNYKPQIDWYYLDYRFFDWLGIRAGRTKIPFGLYNEMNDVDSARIPVLLPQSVYPAASRDYLLAQTGGEVYGNIPIGGAGMLDYRAYGGTIFIDLPPNPAFQNFHVPYVFGGRLMWLTPIEGLQMGGTFQRLSLNANFVLGDARQQYIDAGVLPADSTGNVPFQIPITLWVASVEYTFQSFLFAAEYGRWHAQVESSYPTILDPQVTENERFYVMAGWQASDWLQSSLYYSVLYPQLAKREGKENQQHDVAATLRFDLNEYWLLKLEGHFIHGTADVDPNLNGGQPKANLAENWELFLVKTTAYF